MRKIGFTLIEIIIVVVILGILAAIAVPKVVENMNKARVAEVFGIAGTVARAFDRCLAELTLGQTPTAPEVNICGGNPDFSGLKMADPNSGAGSLNFSYNLTIFGGTNLRLSANGIFSGSVAADRIVFTYNSTSGDTTVVCTGIFINMCK